MEVVLVRSNSSISVEVVLVWKQAYGCRASRACSQRGRLRQASPLPTGGSTQGSGEVARTEGQGEGARTRGQERGLEPRVRRGRGRGGRGGTGSVSSHGTPGSAGLEPQPYLRSGGAEDVTVSSPSGDQRRTLYPQRSCRRRDSYDS